MANIMDLVKLRNKVSRTPFDLSKKIAFSAKVGEVLPVYCKEVLFTDVFDIDVSAFTRTTPVNSAAYTRIKEYYDFYFVPTRLLWNKADTFYTQMDKDSQHATGLTDDFTQVTDTHPYFTIQQVLEYYRRAIYGENKQNALGYNRGYLTQKLMDLLGYGDLDAYIEPESTSSPMLREFQNNATLNPFPLLGYQKIWSDFFRNSQWETSQPSLFNVDYLVGSDMNIPVSQLYNLTRYSQNMFDLQYCNWKKDYFTGLLPESQYGDAASINVDSLLNVGSTSTADILLHTFQGASNGTVNNLFINGDSSDDWVVRYLINGDEPTSSTDGKTGFQLKSSSVKALRDAMGIDLENIQSKFTILALRHAEAKQKWAEITQSTQQDAKSQMEAHFDGDMAEVYSDRCSWLGGTESMLTIDEVVNNNLADDNEPVIRGKGVNTSNGHIKFKAPCHGYLYCIYHAVPELDYAIRSGVRRQNLKTKATDYAIPEFDKTGMVSVPYIELSNFIQPPLNEPALLGYAPRYIDYKTDFDSVHGAFLNGGYDYWVAPFSEEYLMSIWNSERVAVDKYFFKVNPAILNPIFTEDADAHTKTDQLLINCAFRVHAVRPLDRNGLPY